MELKPDAQQTYGRMAAFWQGEMLDRACLDIRVPKDGHKAPALGAPETVEEQWTSVDYAVAKAVATVESYVYLGESLPIARVGLGPDFLAATLGCGLHFSPDTSWAEPAIESWDTFKGFPDYCESKWYKLQVELTGCLTERAEGRFIVEIPDFHPGGDALAALRGSTNCLMDFYDAPQHATMALDHVDRVLCEMVDAFEAITTARGQAHCGPGP